VSFWLRYVAAVIVFEIALHIPFVL